MIEARLHELLKSREFISVATCDLKGRPNAAPKFLLKIEAGYIYLIDYIIGKTWENLKINPRASLSFIDTDTLMGYQINASAEIIEKGPEYNKIVHELLQKQIYLSTTRIIEGVTKGKRHSGFEVGIRDKFVVLKLKVEETLELGTSGIIKRNKV